MYKAFNPDLKCKDFQYEIGKTAIYNGDIKICRRGFHCCEMLLDTLNYYNLFDANGNLNRFCEVYGTGNFEKDEGGNKTVFEKLHVKAEINIKDFLKISFEAIKRKIKIF